MKRTNIFSAFLIFMLVLFAISGCKDKNTVNPKSCKMATLVYESFIGVGFQYDSDNRIIKETTIDLYQSPVDTGYYTYEYKGDSAIVYYEDKQTNPKEVSTRYKFNSKGNVDSYSTSSGMQNKYTYATDGYLKEQVYTNTTTNETITNTFSVQNGNYVSNHHKSNLDEYTVTYEYYTDKENKGTGSNLPVGGVANFNFGNKSKNLLKKETNVNTLGVTGTIIAYTYEFDSEGNVTKETRTSNPGTNQSELIVKYTYNCD